MTQNVLVVDDYGPWRQFVCEELRREGRWRVIGEASDGMAAVRKAQSLKPDLILLDVGLPTLNGLEAARRILADQAGSRILFLSEQRSPDIAAAALNAGARGYLLKSEACRKLRLALEAVANGGRFVSAGLPGEVFETFREPFAFSAHRHQAAFHSDENPLVDEYARFAATALASGSTFVFVAGDGRRDRLRRRLSADGVDVDRAIADGRCLFLDPGTELSKLMIEGSPDTARFRDVAAALIDGAAGIGSRRVTLCGECAPELWRQGRADAAIRLEHLWDELAATAEVDILCGYLMDEPRCGDRSREDFQRICAEHSSIHAR